MNEADRLNTIVQLSDQMLVAARSYRWDEVLAVETKESQLIGEFDLPKALSTNDSVEIKKAIQLILENHKAISAIAEPLHLDLKILLDSFPEPSGTSK